MGAADIARKGASIQPIRTNTTQHTAILDAVHCPTDRIMAASQNRDFDTPPFKNFKMNEW